MLAPQYTERIDVILHQKFLLFKVPYFNEKTDMVVLNRAAVEGCSLVNLLHKHEVAVETHFGQYLKLINFVML
jgi:hypothetical protein